jgi:hypothetical protein
MAADGLMPFLEPLRCILAGIPGECPVPIKPTTNWVLWPPEYYEIEGADGELWLIVKLE